VTKDRRPVHRHQCRQNLLLPISPNQTATYFSPRNVSVNQKDFFKRAQNFLPKFFLTQQKKEIIHFFVRPYQAASCLLLCGRWVSMQDGNKKIFSPHPHFHLLSCSFPNVSSVKATTKKFSWGQFYESVSAVIYRQDFVGIKYRFIKNLKLANV
jgi:hypothetical protein